MLVVDDSPVVRQVLSKLLSAHPAIGRVDIAPNGKLALRKLEKLDPDVITMDVEMPGMDGLATLRRIMRDSPRPVIMLSAFTYKGADKTIRALELGAVDFIQKPSGRLSRDITEVGDELIKKIEAVAFSIRTKKKHALNLNGEAETNVGHRVLLPSVNESGRAIVAIGASTGGTEAIRQVLTGLPPEFPLGIVVVQHMPAGFTRSFAERLNQLCRIEVKEAANRDMIIPGRALIAPGSYHMLVQKGEYGDFVELSKSREVNGHRPSVDVLFNSVAEYYGREAIGVILTGMGRDGASGLKQMHDMGALTIGQNEASCVVYGMPKVAADESAVEVVSDIGEISNILNKTAGGIVNVRGNVRNSN